MSEEKQEQPYRVSISDWITFLGSEKHGAINTILGFGSFVVALLAVLYSMQTSRWYVAIGGIVILVICWLVNLYFSRQERNATKLLDKVMHGDFQKAENIRDEWYKQKGTNNMAKKRRVKFPKPLSRFLSLLVNWAGLALILAWLQWNIQASQTMTIEQIWANPVYWLLSIGVFIDVIIITLLVMRKNTDEKIDDIQQVIVRIEEIIKEIPKTSKS